CRPQCSYILSILLFYDTSPHDLYSLSLHDALPICNYFLRVYIDKIDGVSLDDCEKMSAKLGKELDEKDPIRDPYYLEVSSPGLDRPLKTDSDLKRNLNKDIEISLYRAFNNEKNYEGKLIDVNEKEILITDDDNNISITREYIANIKLAIKV